MEATQLEKNSQILVKGFDFDFPHEMETLFLAFTHQQVSHKRSRSIGLLASENGAL